MLSLYQSPANCRNSNAEGKFTHKSPPNCKNSNVEGNFTHKINYRHYGHFLGPEFYIYPEREGSLSSQGRGDGWNLEITNFLEHDTGTDYWQCRHTRGRCSHVSRITEGRKTRALCRVSGYHRECTTLQSSCCTNRVQLYVITPFAPSLTPKLQCWTAYSTGNEVISINAQNNQEYTH